MFALRCAIKCISSCHISIISVLFRGESIRFALCLFFKELISFCVRTQHQLHRFKHVRSTSNVINVTRNETFWFLFFFFFHYIYRDVFTWFERKKNYTVSTLYFYLCCSSLTYAYMLNRMQKQRKHDGEKKKKRTEPIQIRRKSSPKRVGRSEHGNNERLQSSSASYAAWPNEMRHNTHGNEWGKKEVREWDRAHNERLQNF